MNYNVIYRGCLLCLAIAVVNFAVFVFWRDSLPPIQHIKRPQNSAAGLLLRTRKYGHATPLPKTLQWLHVQVEVFPNWTTTDPQDTVPIKRVYLYSAIVSLHGTPATGSHIFITAFQEKRVGQLWCCLKHGGDDVIWSPAPVAQALANPNNSDDQREVFAVVYRCHVPLSTRDLRSARVIVTPTSVCPAEVEYLPVHLPETVNGGLAVCGKVAFGSSLDPLKLVEWFEMQKLLGVDKIQILDYGNPENVTKVFEYYQKTGLLAMFPYKLPGRPWGRGFTDETRVLHQLNQDEDFSLLECRLRLAGFDYVMGIDMDEIIVPRRLTSLKPFFQEMFDRDKELAGVYFLVQFFVDEFGQEDMDAPLRVLRFLKSTFPRFECQKYAYVPSKTSQCSTHSMLPHNGFTTTVVSPEEAVIHHYRRCPHVWPNCHPVQIVDRSITRFRDELVPRVKDVLSKVGLQLV